MVVLLAFVFLIPPTDRNTPTAVHSFSRQITGKFYVLVYITSTYFLTAQRTIMEIPDLWVENYVLLHELRDKFWKVFSQDDIIHLSKICSRKLCVNSENMISFGMKNGYFFLLLWTLQEKIIDAQDQYMSNTWQSDDVIELHSWVETKTLIIQNTTQR